MYCWILLLDAALDQSATPQTRVTKKEMRQGRASAIPSSDGELISEDELEYDEDSLEDSGSEFQISDEEDIIVGQDSDAEIGLIEALEAMDEEDAENAMMAAAIQLSMDTNIDRSPGASNCRAGPSTPKTRSAAAALRAVAAERRLKAAKHEVFDTNNLESSNAFPDLEASEMASSSDSEPLANGKGKGKAKLSKQKTAKRSTVAQRSRVMTIAQAKVEGRARRKAGSSKYANRAEEMELRKKLGRKLTHVRIALLALRS